MMRLLRAVAVAIALAALVDPAVTVDRATRARLSLVVQDARDASAVRVADRLTRVLGRAYEIVPAITSDAAAAIVIGDRYPEPMAFAVGPPFAGAISTVTLARHNIAITHIAAPRETLAATSIRVEVDVDAQNAAGQTTDVIAHIDRIVVGRASHRWLRASERWTASLDIGPFGEPPYVVRVAAGSSAADVMIARRNRPIRIQAYDPRPSWTSTFTRRALEADARFEVESLVASSRKTAARTSAAVPLGDARIERFDALVVGGVDVLSAADAAALDRYLRARGGAVILLPDSRALSPAALDLLAEGGAPPSLTERLLERPATLAHTRGGPSLEASELLLIGPPGIPVDVLATAPGSEAAPVVISMPHGRGRLIVSGAMDAWRFRADAQRSFDRFWQAVVAGAALATPPRIDVSVTPAPLGRAEPARIVVRGHDADARSSISAAVDGRAVRLWPAIDEGVHYGGFVADTNDRRSTITARVSAAGDDSASVVVPVLTDARHAYDATLAPLAMLAATRRGVNVDADHLDDLVGFIASSVTPPHAPVRAHPMRSPWWIAPFAGCLAAEWWLRRRGGLR